MISRTAPAAALNRYIHKLNTIPSDSSLAIHFPERGMILFRPALSFACFAAAFSLAFTTTAIAAEGWAQCHEAHRNAGHSDPLRIEPGTGADARNYPPDQQADFLHMRLEIDIPGLVAAIVDIQDFAWLCAAARPWRWSSH